MLKIRRFVALMMTLLMWVPTVAGAADCARTFRSGPTDAPKIAVTVDDVHNVSLLSDIMDLCDQYHVKITVFPIGKEILESDSAVWQRAVDSGHEIGSHTNNHRSLIKLNGYQIKSEMSGLQKRLNAALGYEYPLKIMRPPYGVLGVGGGASRAGRELYKLGYHSIILWSVSNTDPDKALKQTKNGSILLYHTNNKDYRCLQQLIPALVDAGFELVTVSDLLQLDENGDAPAETPEPTLAPKADATPEATATPKTVATPEVTATLKTVATPKATATSKATVTPKVTAAPSAKATPTATPSPQPTATPTLTPTPRVTPIPTKAV